MGPDLHLYHLELELVRLKAIHAVEGVASPRDEAALERRAGEIERLYAAVLDRRVDSRVAKLARRLQLVTEDIDLLWTVVAGGVDPRVVPQLQLLAGGDARRGVTLELFARIADLDGARARDLAQRLVDSSHPLVADGVLVWNGDALGATTMRPLVAPARTVTWLSGRDDVDPALAGAARVVVVPERLDLDAQQRGVLDGLPAMLGGEPAPIVVIEGAEGSGRRTALAHAAAQLGRAVIALELRRLPHGQTALEGALAALRRECRLTGALPVIADLGELRVAEGEPPVALRAVARALEDMPGPVAATVGPEGIELALARPLARVRWHLPDAATRRALWQRTLGDVPADAELGRAVDDAAHRYELGAGAIARAVASARLVAGRHPLAGEHVTAGVRAHISERLGDLALRQEIRQSWDDLVLAPDIIDQIAMLVARVRYARHVLDDWGFSAKLPKGQGVAALFSGPPGTGKTMVAGLIARELDLELYQVDLSKVVSKWVGETEKMLAKLFDAAEAGHALLLFDEADSLFAKRTDVRSAVDRYANLEVNYLLQRIESFGGVSILTTNLEASIDPALRRRLAASVAFWPPDQAEREQLWERMLASRAPVQRPLDIAKLAATYEDMTGANIRNAVLAAAFLAAAESAPITYTRLDRAARAEYAAMGRVLDRK